MTSILIKKFLPNIVVNNRIIYNIVHLGRIFSECNQNIFLKIFIFFLGIQFYIRDVWVLTETKPITFPLNQKQVFETSLDFIDKTVSSHRQSLI